MRVRKPDYYDRFSCLAGACPDTCCAGWDVVVDKESLARYEALDTPFGARVRAALTVDEDGDACFQTKDGFCPLLTAERLCSVQLELGEGAVCTVCRAHPRFIDEYGALREESLACSCPAAAALMLAGEAPAGFLAAENDEPEVDCDDVDRALLEALIPCRENAFALLQDRTQPLGERLALLLEYARGLQDSLDEGDAAALPGVPVPRSVEKADGSGVTGTLFETLRGLEILSPKWLVLLEETAGAGPCARPAPDTGNETEYEHFAVYLTNRWFLKADFDGDVYAKAAFVCFACLALWSLEGRAPREELVRLWCKEMEHCQENMDALGELACEVSPEELAGALALRGETERPH